MSSGLRPQRSDAASEAQREQILVATHAMLGEERSGSTFSVDAVAARAGVARAIMQQRFGNAARLLAALWDDLLSRGCLVHLPRAFQSTDARATLAEVIAIYGAFWHAERSVVRRIKAYAALDPELERALRTRERDRREGMQRLARRLTPRTPAAGPVLDLADVLCMLTAFETFDGVAGPERSIAAVLPVVQAFATAVLDHGGSSRVSLE